MARADIKMPDEFLERISKVGSDFDSIAETVLETGGEVVLARTKSNLSAVIGKGTKYESRSTGELESALGMTTVKMDKQGNHNIKIGFAIKEPSLSTCLKIQICSRTAFVEVDDSKRSWYLSIASPLCSC